MGENLEIIEPAPTTLPPSGSAGGDLTGTYPNPTLAVAPIPLSQKGVANGVASLDSGGMIPAGQMPISVMDYKGTYNANTNTPSLSNGSGNTGDVYVVSVAGSRDFGAGSITFAIGDWVIYDGSIYQKVINSNLITSVFGRTGIVTAQSGDYTEAQISFTDITTNDVSTSKHGYAPKLPGGTTTFLRGDGTYAAPSGSGGAFTPYAEGVRAGGTGTITLSSLTTADLDATNLIASLSNVSVGDVIEVTFSGIATISNGSDARLDALITSGSSAKYVSTRDTNRGSGWFIPNPGAAVSYSIRLMGSYYWTVTSNDLTGSTFSVKMKYIALGSGACQLVNTTDFPVVISLVNLGH